MSAAVDAWSAITSSHGASVSSETLRDAARMRASPCRRAAPLPYGKRPSRLSRGREKAPAPRLRRDAGALRSRPRRGSPSLRTGSRSRLDFSSPAIGSCWSRGVRVLSSSPGSAHRRALARRRARSDSSPSGLGVVGGAPASPPRRWKTRVRPVLEHFVDRTPGSFVEEKEYSLVWHYRMSDPEFGEMAREQLAATLDEMLAESELCAIRGRSPSKSSSPGRTKAKWRRRWWLRSGAVFSSLSVMTERTRTSSNAFPPTHGPFMSRRRC